MSNKLVNELRKLNDEHKERREREARESFSKISQQCRDAAKEGKREIIVDNVDAITWKLLNDQGLTLRVFQSDHNETSVEIGW